jgi:hypothetical protein
LRVVREDGSPIHLGAAALRNLLRIVDGLFLYLVAAIAVWASPTRQRLGDRAAGTYVVLDSDATYPRRVAAMTEWRPPPTYGGNLPTYTEDAFAADLARADRFKSQPPS